MRKALPSAFRFLSPAADLPDQPKTEVRHSIRFCVYFLLSFFAGVITVIETRTPLRFFNYFAKVWAALVLATSSLDKVGLRTSDPMARLIGWDFHFLLGNRDKKALGVTVRPLLCVMKPDCAFLLLTKVGRGGILAVKKVFAFVSRVTAAGGLPGLQYHLGHKGTG